MRKAASEALQDGKLRHPGASRQQGADGQDLRGGQNLPCCWPNSQQALRPSVEVPAESCKHPSVCDGAPGPAATVLGKDCRRGGGLIKGFL